MKNLRVIGAVLLSIIFTIVLTCGIPIFTFSSFLNGDNIKDIINENNLYENIPFEIENENLNLEFVEQFLEIPETKELISEIAGDYVDYILGKGEMPIITEAEINKIINSKYVKENLNLTAVEKEEIKTELKLQIEEINETLANDMTLISDELFEDDLIKFIFSDTIKTIIIIALIVIAILIGLCLWSWYRPFAWIGVSAVISGTLLLLIKSIISNILLKDINEELLNTIIFDNLFKTWQNYSLYTLITGILLIVIYFVIKRRKKLKES